MAASGPPRLEQNCRELSRSSDRSAIPPRRDAEVPDEGAGHVALVSEARQQRGIDRRPARSQEPADETHSPLHKIGVRSCPDFAGETAQELEPAHP